MAHDVFFAFSADDVEQIFGNDKKYILDPEYKNVNLDTIKENLLKLREARWKASVCATKVWQLTFRTSGV